MNPGKPIRVLHFGRFYNDRFGGSERHVAALLPGLVERGVEVANVVANDHFAKEVLSQDGYPIYKLPSLGVFAGTALCPTMPLFARRLSEEGQFDIAHLHFPDPLTHLVTYALPPSVKIVIGWHSDIIRQQRLLKLYRPFLDNIVGRADAVIAATPKHFSSSTQMGAISDPAKKHVIPYGIDYGPYTDARNIKEATGIRSRYPGRKIVFALGRHVYYKGFEYLIRAMAELDDAVLLLGSSGPLTESLKALAAEILPPGRVEFLGRVSEAQLPSYYHACDVYCMPSTQPSEAFGLVQIEAMACGKPVVCCELNNGVTYVNQHEQTGLVVPPADPAALAGALRRLFDNPDEARRLGAAGKRRALGHFDIPSMCDKTLEVYRRVLAEA